MSLGPEQERKVLDGAISLFARHKLNDITLERLTKASGVAAFDILRHYQSKENILAAVLDREIEMMAGAAHSPELRFPGETLRDELEVLAKVMLHEYRARIGLLRSLLEAAIADPKVGFLFYSAFVMRGRQLFTEFLKTRASLGELRPDLDVEAAAAMFLSSLTGVVLMMEIFGGNQVERFDDDRVIAELTNVFLEGASKR